MFNIVDEINRRAVPESPAVIAAGVTVSFAELMNRVAALANWLQGREGFCVTGRVGLVCANGVEYIVVALGILKAGACLVPLASELTEAERQELIERTGLCGIITVGKDRKWSPYTVTGFSHEQEFIALNPAFIRFSSGTTGRSKGVVLSHEKLRERIVAANAGLEIGPSDRVLWMLPMAHHFAVSIVLYLYHGACTVLSRSHLAAEVLSTAAETKATVIYGAPFHFSLLAADTGEEVWSDLRLAVATAAPLTMAVAKGFYKRFGKHLVQGMGIIEVGLPLMNISGAYDSPTAVGTPQPAYEVALRDDCGLAVAQDSVGELWVKGPGMFDAYLSPWQCADDICSAGWFATGDLAVSDADGRIYLRGRKKSAINVNGMKVFPEEVEAVLETHPAVRRCRVSGAAHPVLGTVPVAEVILETGEMGSARELIRWCRRLLSIYKVPSKVTFVENLPLTASGKIRRT